MPRKSDPAYKTEGSVFATRLREIMKERGENQTTLADKLTSQYVAIQRQTISLYMNGQSKPDTERLTAIARVLNVSADWLLGLSDERSINGDLAQACRYTGLPSNSVNRLHELATTNEALKASLWVIDEILNERSQDLETWVWRAAMSSCCTNNQIDEFATIRHDADAKLLEIAKLGDKSDITAVDVPIFDYETICTSAAIEIVQKSTENALKKYKEYFRKVFEISNK